MFRPEEKEPAWDTLLTKVPVDAQGEAPAKRESNWYLKAKDKKIKGLPLIYETSPLKMGFIRERRNGRSVLLWKTLRDMGKVFQGL